MKYAFLHQFRWEIASFPENALFEEKKRWLGEGAWALVCAAKQEEEESTFFVFERNAEMNANEYSPVFFFFM